MHSVPLTVGEKIIQCVITAHPRAKRIRISVRSDNSVLVTHPKATSRKRALAFLDEHTEWIAKNLEKNTHRVRLLPEHAGTKEHYRQNKEKARKRIHHLVEKWNAGLSFPVDAIHIRNQRTRWGSCSGERTLSFHYKIIFLPQHLQDYIIVHELCHLKHMNHSVKFWSLVESILPESPRYRDELKRWDG